MARPRKPTKILELKGAFKKDPQRKRLSEPKSDTPLGDPPKHLRKKVQGIWCEIASHASPDVLTASDRIALELAAELLFEFRIDPIEFPANKLSRLESLLAKFGMNPSDRSKMSVGKPRDPANPFADF